MIASVLFDLGDTLTSGAKGYEPQVRSAESVVNALKRLGIARYFDVVITSARVGYRKTHPAIFLKALESLSTPPREAVFVGDDPISDVLGAKRVGMVAVWLNRGGGSVESVKADYTLSSLLQLPNLLETLASRL